VRGGYRTVVNRLIAEIQKMNGRIVVDAPVQRVQSEPDGGVRVQSEKLSQSFDQVIATIPSRPLAQIAPQLDSQYVKKLQEVKYLGVVCIVLVLKRQLTPIRFDISMEVNESSSGSRCRDLIGAELTLQNKHDANHAQVLHLLQLLHVLRIQLRSDLGQRSARNRRNHLVETLGELLALNTHASVRLGLHPLDGRVDHNPAVHLLDFRDQAVHHSPVAART